MASEVEFFTEVNKYDSSECFAIIMKVDNIFSANNITKCSEIITAKKFKSSWQIIFKSILGSYYDVFESMKIYLKRIDSNEHQVMASLFFKIQNSTGTFNFASSIEDTFSPLEQAVSLKPRYSFCTHDGSRLRRLYDDKNYVIRCSLLIGEFFNKDKNITGCDSLINVSELQSNFKSCYENNSFSDVTFCFGDEKLYANKMVLSARSPVFKKMFEQNMEEAVSDNVTITDIEKSVFNVFLIFLYTGVIENTEFDTVMSLYSTADKYQVTTLFNSCSDILLHYITKRTASIILKVAHMHRDELLKVKTIKFICDNFTKVEKTSEWRQLLDEDPHLASYTLKIVSSSERKKQKRKRDLA